MNQPLLPIADQEKIKVLSNMKIQKIQYIRMVYTNSESPAKTEIIKNPEAFRHAFTREQKKDGKTVKMFILQAREF